jgi:S1-C subfamily serine protease
LLFVIAGVAALWLVIGAIAFGIYALSDSKTKPIGEVANAGGSKDSKVIVPPIPRPPTDQIPPPFPPRQEPQLQLNPQPFPGQPQVQPLPGQPRLPSNTKPFSGQTGVAPGFPTNPQQPPNPLEESKKINDAKQAELTELFSKPVDLKPPSVKVAMLTKNEKSAPLEVPSFHSLRSAKDATKAAAAKNTKLTLDEIKQATVYIKVDAGDRSGTGSGFYIGSENGVALVATNHHVIESALRRRVGEVSASKITVVFNSGVPGQERESTARAVGIDPIADLAVLRLDTPPTKLPKPIDPWATPTLTETMEVRICGFPFGESLATATSNPNISVNAGTVSSLRLGKSGTVEQVQISGSLNPGNSGGPIVDKEGRLAGIAVATNTGSGLGFAVPVNDLISLLEGRLLLTAFIPSVLCGNSAKFRVLMP